MKDTALPILWARMGGLFLCRVCLPVCRGIFSLAQCTERRQQLFITRNRKDGFDEFPDDLIDEAIEANGCCCGAGRKEDRLDVVVELGRRSDDPDSRLHRITACFKARSDVENRRVGEEFDFWNGGYQDIHDNIEQQDSAWHKRSGHFCAPYPWA